MKYQNLTQSQRGWIAEMQRASSLNKNNFIYVPRVICDTETGEVYSITEGFFGGFEIISRIGSIPKKAVPYRNRSFGGKRTCRIREETKLLAEGQPW